ncbi:MAG: hypothetical protein ACI9W4_002823 [Rhodothermales bacterium]|jgi:hypothetical protein
MSSAASVPSALEIVGVDPVSFDRLAARVVQYQREHTEVYARYCESASVLEAYSGETPHLPIAAFKHGPVYAGPVDGAERVFQSSGTSGQARSRHYVRDLTYYHASLEASFAKAFGPGPFRILAHLPHYAEESSLVYMVARLIEKYGAPGSGFFLDELALLQTATASAGAPIMLFGAAFGLLKLAEAKNVRLPQSAVVMETGGMKTHRQSVTRASLHESLTRGFGLAAGQIWSEYGMCELLSQCYAQSGDPYTCPPWMRCHVVDPEQPWIRKPDGEPGALAVLDLANTFSVSAILTEDRAVARGEGFEILGRLTGAELRGCNHLLVTK